jgi:hypothetical protein
MKRGDDLEHKLYRVKRLKRSFYEPYLARVKRSRRSTDLILPELSRVKRFKDLDADRLSRVKRYSFSNLSSEGCSASLLAIP